MQIRNRINLCCASTRKILGCTAFLFFVIGISLPQVTFAQEDPETVTSINFGLTPKHGTALLGFDDQDYWNHIATVLPSTPYNLRNGLGVDDKVTLELTVNLLVAKIEDNLTYADPLTRGQFSVGSGGVQGKFKNLKEGYYDFIVYVRPDGSGNLPSMVRVSTQSGLAVAQNLGNYKDGVVMLGFRDTYLAQDEDFIFIVSSTSPIINGVQLMRKAYNSDPTKVKQFWFSDHFLTNSVVSDGSLGNPFVVLNGLDFDLKMSQLVRDHKGEKVVINLLPGHFKTLGTAIVCPQRVQSPTNPTGVPNGLLQTWEFPNNWMMQGSVDLNKLVAYKRAVSKMETIETASSLEDALLSSLELDAQGHKQQWISQVGQCDGYRGDVTFFQGEAIKIAQPDHQVVRRIKFNGNYDQMYKVYWDNLNSGAVVKPTPFNLHGIWVMGNNSSVKECLFKDLGGIGPAETFPVMVFGAYQGRAPMGTVFKGQEVAYNEYSGTQSCLAPSLMTVFGLGGAMSLEKDQLVSNNGKESADPWTYWKKHWQFSKGGLIHHNRVMVADRQCSQEQSMLEMRRPLTDFEKSEVGFLLLNRTVPETNRPGGEGQSIQALSIAYVDGADIYNNYTNGASVGIYQDYWYQKNVVVRDNIFRRCRTGVFFRPSPLRGFGNDNFLVTRNKIGMIPTLDGGRNGIIFYTNETVSSAADQFMPTLTTLWPDSYRAMNNVQIKDNNIFLENEYQINPDGSLKGSNYFNNGAIYVKDVNGLVISGNTIDSRLNEVNIAGDPSNRKALPFVVDSSYRLNESNQNVYFDPSNKSKIDITAEFPTLNVTLKDNFLTDGTRMSELMKDYPHPFMFAHKIRWLNNLLSGDNTMRWDPPLAMRQQFADITIDKAGGHDGKLFYAGGNTITIPYTITNNNPTQVKKVNVQVRSNVAAPEIQSVPIFNVGPGQTVNGNVIMTIDPAKLQAEEMPKVILGANKLYAVAMISKIPEDFEQTQLPYLLPDLSLDSIMVASTVPNVGAVNVVLNISNKGKGLASSSKARLELLDGAAVIYTAHINIPPLAKGESYTSTGAFNFPGILVAGKQYMVRVRLDPDNEVMEEDELWKNSVSANNEQSKIVTVVPVPTDLTISSISVNPVKPETYASFTVTFTARNMGVGVAPAHKAKISFNRSSPKTLIVPVPLINPGQSVTVNAIFPESTATAAGNNIPITVTENSDGAVVETNKANNAKTIYISVKAMAVSISGTVSGTLYSRTAYVSGAMVAHVPIAGNGFYRFVGLKPGTYQVYVYKKVGTRSQKFSQMVTIGAGNRNAVVNL